MSEGIMVSETPLNELVAAAHELKTPLSIIMQLTAAIEDEELSLTPAEKRIAMERIRLSADRTLRLVRGLTIAYRLDDQPSQLSFRFEQTPININQICEEVAHEIMPFAQQHTQQLNLHLLARRQLVVGNNELLRSVLFNLIDNAIRHNQPQTTIDVTLRRRNDVVRVCVHDNGPGLSKGDFKRLRQQLGRQLQPLGRSSGSGLGLYIASQMAEAMNGCIGIGNTKSGADFHVDLLQSKQLSFL